MGKGGMHIGFVGRPLGRSLHMWEDNFKMDLREIGWSVMDWTGMSQDRDK
jgi:hypothetical protein